MAVQDHDLPVIGAVPRRRFSPSFLDGGMKRELSA
jgi:hypothetical protein